MPNQPATQQPSAPGGTQAQPNTGGLLAAMFPTGGTAQPSTEPQPTQPVAQPVGTQQPTEPAQPQQPTNQAQPLQQPAPVVDTEEDIEPEIDPAEAASGQVLKSYQSALKKANNEAKNLRAAKKQLEDQVQQLTVTNQALQAQVVPTKRELAFYRSIHEQSGSANGGLNSVLYPALLWQAIQPHLQWNGDQPTNLDKALADTRAAYPALFQPMPPVNGGEGATVTGQGAFNMNSFIRGGIKGNK